MTSFSSSILDRRHTLIGLVALAASGRAARGDAASRDRFEAVRASIGGRLGVAALDTGSGRRIAFAADDRFAMASTFKLALAAAILREVDRGRLRLDQPVLPPPGPLPAYSPVVAALRPAGAIPVERLARAIVEVSDNGAANMLLALTGGPAGFTRFVRAAGDRATRLDRIETDLNENRPGDPRDTTTPAAMLGLMHRLLLGPILSPASSARLMVWLEASGTGVRRLRAGLPADWRAGDKTGTGERGSVNDLCIAWPPARAPILIACYLDGSARPRAELEAAHAEVARIVAASFA